MINDTPCLWALSSEQMKTYHDYKWGKPEHNDRELFAMLILEGAQAGLSWATILKKEDNYRSAFDGFDPEKIAEYDDVRINELMNDPGIIRNRLKINSAVTNARAFLKIRAEFGSFDSYIWHFTEGQVIDHHLTVQSDMPVSNKLSDRISKDLRKRGFKFVGTTIIYSYMQAIGMINDHLETCPYR